MKAGRAVRIGGLAALAVAGLAAPGAEATVPLPRLSERSVVLKTHRGPGDLRPVTAFTVARPARAVRAGRYPGYPEAKAAAARSRTGAGKPVVALRRSPAPVAGVRAAASSPQLYIGSIFDGLGQVAAGDNTPADAQVAVGSTAIVEMVNNAVAIYSKSGRLRQKVTANSFFNAGSDDLSDPQIFYDPITARFYAAELDVTTNGTIIAVSDGPDPTGDWTLARFTAGGGFCPDQPKLGVSDDVVVVTRELFSGNCADGGGDSIGSLILVANKRELLDPKTETFSADAFGPDRRNANIVAARSMTSTKVQYLAAADHPTSRVVRLLEFAGAPPVGGFVHETDIPVTRFDAPPNARQRGSAKVLDTIDDRLVDGVYRNGVLYLGANDGCQFRGDIERSCARVIALSTGARKLLGEDDLGFKGQDAYYPAIGVDPANNLLVTFGYSGGPEYPSLGAIIYTRGGFSDVQTIASGTSPLVFDSDSVQRMGDYFGAGADPARPATVWGTGMYGAGAGRWGTVLAQMSLNRRAVKRVPRPLGGTYTGTTSQRQAIRLRVSLDGRLLVGLRYRLVYRCGDGSRHSTVETVLSDSDPDKLRGRSFAFSVDVGADAFQRSEHVGASGRFAGARARGVLTGVVRSRRHGTCRTGRVRWSAS